jgi:hypothetical protein
MHSHTLAVFPTGEPARLEPAQQTALDKVAERWGLPSPVTVHPMFGDSAVMVEVPGMWLGIEVDGYTHS